MFEGIDKLIIVYDEDLGQSESSYTNSVLSGNEPGKKVIWRAQDSRLFKQGLATCFGSRPVRDLG